MEPDLQANEQPEAPNPDLENSIRFDVADTLSLDYQKEVAALAQEIIEHSDLKRAGKVTTEQIEHTVSTVAANLVRAYWLDPTCFVAVSMGSQYYTASRYNCQDIGYNNIRRTIEYMKDRRPALISYHRGFRNKETGFTRSTRIQLTPAFLEYFMNVFRDTPPLFAIVHDPAFECIRLKDRNKKLIEYADNDETNGMRERLARWNEFLDQQWTDLYVTDEQFASIYKNIDADDVDGISSVTEDDDVAPRHVDLTRNRLYRVFNNSSLAEGGRFYGGWWQTIPSKWRPHITINWHPTRELDYSNMQPAMLYAKCGLPLKEDAYAIEGIDPSYRKLLKKTLFQLINAREDQRIRAPSPEMLPPGWTWKKLQQALIEKHRPIEKYLRTGVGIELQRIDSEIAEDIMHSMMERNMLILPIHDSFLMRRGHSAALRDHMRRAYTERIGQDIGTMLDLSFADQLGPGKIVSSFQEIEAILDQASRVPRGYDGYFERKRAFLAGKSRDWHYQFKPYESMSYS
jgi:hypothetical protein